MTEVFNADGSETLEHRARRAAAWLTQFGPSFLFRADWEALEEYSRVQLLELVPGNSDGVPF